MVAEKIDVLTERLQFAIATEWLAQALDQSSPDTDRWWLSVALINGLCTESHGQPVHQGYHLVESKHLLKGQEHGIHSLSFECQFGLEPSWNGSTTTSVVAHEAGADAAKWMMEQLENSGEERRKLLIEWCKLLLEKELIQPLESSNSNPQGWRPITRGFQ